MKKVLLFITMAASLLFTQCKKSEESAPSVGRPVEMTVTVGPGSKTDITASTGGITWSTGDKLYVGYDGKYVGYLTLARGEGGVTGMFTGSVGLTDADEGKELTFHFYYLGSADHTGLAKGATSVEVDFSSQDIIKGTDGKLTSASLQHVCYGSAEGTVTDGTVTDINVTLVSKVAIARFSFTNNGAIGNGNPYTGALKLSGTNICNKMTVNFNSEGFSCTGTAGDISLTDATSSEKYVMLVPTSSTTGPQTLTFTGSVKGETTLENGIRPNKFYGLDGAREVQVKPKFSVAANKTVEFSKGNLWYYNGTFDFEGEQWYRNPWESDQHDWNPQKVEHFYWSKTASVAYSQNYNDPSASSSDVFFTNDTETTAKSDFTVNGETGVWRTLSKAEYTYLLDTRAGNRFAKGRVGDVNGLFIFPDEYTSWPSGYSTNGGKGMSKVNDKSTYYPSLKMDDGTWRVLEKSGVAFLPAAGYRNGTSCANIVSDASYYTSTNIDKDYAYRMYCLQGNLHSGDGAHWRPYGLAVRLVRDL